MRLKHNHDVAVTVFCDIETNIAHVTIKRMNTRGSYYSKTYKVKSGSPSDTRMSYLLDYYTRLNGIVNQPLYSEPTYHFNTRNERVINDGVRVL